MKKSKKLWLSLGAITLCAVIIAVVCVVVFVLPKDGDGIDHIQIEKPVTPNAPSRGELKLRLVRERLEMKTLNTEHGYPYLSSDGTPKDFSSTKENIFGLDGDKLIGPGCYFKAEMAVSNQAEGAFEYWLEIVTLGGEKLAAQLELTIETDGAIIERQTLDGGFTSKPLPAVASGKTSRFVATLTYLKTVDNNETQNTTLAFDMSVHSRLI